ncbi:MAG: replication protein [Gammaproteobacteria bacterium]
MTHSGRKGNSPLLENVTRQAPPAPNAFVSQELTVFQTFLCNTDEERDKLSNTIELWDAVPKYVTRKDMDRMRDGDYLPVLERRFEHRGRAFLVRVYPARIRDDKGKEREYYPSAREELIEAALLKIATDPGSGFLEEGSKSGAVFTGNRLRKELTKRGRGVPYPDIVRSLDILSLCSVEIQSENSECLLRSAILPTIGRVNRKNYLKDQSAKWFVHFNQLVAQGIGALTYRQFDYDRMMAHRSQLARYLHKRLAHNYVSASLTGRYTVWFSTLQRDSGLLNHARKRQAIDKLEEALDELVVNHVLLSWSRSEERRRMRDRRRVEDVMYDLVTHTEFNFMVKAANARQRDARVERRLVAYDA